MHESAFGACFGGGKPHTACQEKNDGGEAQQRRIKDEAHQLLDSAGKGVEQEGGVGEESTGRSGGLVVHTIAVGDEATNLLLRHFGDSFRTCISPSGTNTVVFIAGVRFRALAAAAASPLSPAAVNIPRRTNTSSPFEIGLDRQKVNSTPPVGGTRSLPPVKEPTYSRV